MKKLAILAAVLLLHSCSGAEPAPETAPLPLPDEVAAASPGSDATLASDPFAADQAATSSTSTPAAATPSANAAAASTESQAADSLLATPVPESASPKADPAPQALATPAPSTPTDTAEAIPAPQLSQNHEVPATPVMPPAKTDPRKFNTYEAYKEYEEKEAGRRDLQKSYDQRALFPHEGGEWQIGIDYVRSAFPQLDFDPTIVTKNLDTFGGIFSVSYFPVHSFSYGRLGLSVNYSLFWTKYVFDTAPGVSEKSTVHSMDSYGARAVYEFDYLLGQMFVPFVYLGMDKVKVRPYNLTAGTSVVADYPAKSFTRNSFGGGLHFNLNRLEPVSASRGLANLGIRKTYLTYTYLSETGGNTGSSHLLGLRFEY